MLRLSAALFCTGFTTLLCQLSWQRMLAPLLGAGTEAALLSVAAFLLGLALGGALAARYADRMAPEGAARAAALCAAITAVFGFFSKLFFYDLLVPALGVASTPVILAVCFVALLPPTLLLGAVLPLAARAMVTTLEMVADRVGWLLTLAAFGAALAALLGGWVIFGEIGFSGAVAVTVPLQLLAAGLALTLSTKRRYWSRKRRDQRVRDRLARAGQPPGAPPPADPLPAGAGMGSLPFWYAVAALTGFSVAALVLMWERVLGHLGQVHAYLLPSILGLFLLGVAAGLNRATRRLEWLRGDPRQVVLASLSFALALPLALILLLWWSLPHGPMPMLLPDQWRLGGEPFDLMLLLTLLLVLPSGVLFGNALPAMQRAVHTEKTRVGARTGWLQAAALAGAAAGALCIELAAVPLLGTAHTLRLLALLALLLGLGWLGVALPDLRAGRPGHPVRGRVAVILATACSVVPVLLLPGNTGFWTRVHGLAAGGEAIVAEGRAGVAVWRDDTLRREEETVEGPLFLAGTLRGALPFEFRDLALGAVGPLMHPSPRRVLVLGVSSGAAAFAAARMPNVQEVQAIEPFPPVLDLLREHAARQPQGALPAMLANPRIRLSTEDARRFLARSAPQSFEVIVMDSGPSQSAQAGLVHSRQYFELVSSRLAPGGIAVINAPSWSVVQSFTSVFPFAVMFRPADVLIGSHDPLPSPRPRLLSRLANPAASAPLVGAERERVLALLRQVSGDTLLWLPSTGRTDNPLTDMVPRDEYFVNNTVRMTRGQEMPEDVRADQARR